MTKEMFFVIDDPKLISLINEIKNNAKPINELYKSLGRGSTIKAMNKLQLMGLRFQIGAKEYFSDPFKHEFEFAKTCLGMHNNRRKNLFSLNGGVEVQTTGKDLMILKVDFNKVDTLNPTIENANNMLLEV